MTALARFLGWFGMVIVSAVLGLGACIGLAVVVITVEAFVR